MSDGHTTASRNSYTVTFHPAFASRCVVDGDDGECEVYKQQGAHKFEPGEKHPKKHTIKVKGGKWDRDISLEVDDPRHAIAKIVVEFYAEGHVPGGSAIGVETDPVVERFTIYNDGTTCPPHCDPKPGGIR
jgi:hypothetical protein